ncbi:fumarylacetoacetate hydrolase family protein [Glacieibacterium megasporae]|uniref:fumarylacetoacetate hydrolase family protein n=1 Tax=Glacieibacterium megasporae TaxID=2835787 RepID=UPI001C1DF4E7|nr:fumarylacetoacetate hydrolase family protein [Polymorphobacter megasporae]UAJ12595.1 fumarylacetoacetate hydrolase family protein [Polymorphobacter megasporae]
MPPIFALPARPAAAIAGSADTFPVGRIICIGRNYEAHAREMGKDPSREAPFFFAKCADALVPNGATVPYPPETANYHFEGELVIAIGKAGAKLSEADALDLVFGYAVGLDMTRRDLQLEARDKGRPWEIGKNFAFSAPMAAISPVADVGHMVKAPIRLTVNGAIKQDGDIADLIWDCAEQIAYLSRFERLLPGDLIFTGTPAGVGAVVPGDVIDVTIGGLTPLRVTIGGKEVDFA